MCQSVCLLNTRFTNALVKDYYFYFIGKESEAGWEEVICLQSNSLRAAEAGFGPQVSSLISEAMLQTTMLYRILINVCRYVYFRVLPGIWKRDIRRMSETARRWLTTKTIKAIFIALDSAQGFLYIISQFNTKTNGGNEIPNRKETKNVNLTRK